MADIVRPADAASNAASPSSGGSSKAAMADTENLAALAAAGNGEQERAPGAVKPPPRAGATLSKPLLLPAPSVPLRQPPAPDLVVEGRELYLRSDPAWFAPAWAAMWDIVPVPWEDKDRPIQERVALAIRAMVAQTLEVACALQPDDPYYHLYTPLSGVKQFDALVMVAGAAAEVRSATLTELEVGESYPANNGCALCYIERPATIPFDFGLVRLGTDVKVFTAWVPLHSSNAGYDVSDTHIMVIGGAPFTAFHLEFRVDDVDDPRPVEVAFHRVPAHRPPSIAQADEGIFCQEIDSWPEGSTQPSAPRPPSLTMAPPPYMCIGGVNLLRHFDSRLFPPAWLDLHDSMPWRDTTRSKQERALSYLQCDMVKRSGHSWCVIIPASKASEYSGPRVAFNHSFQRFCSLYAIPEHCKKNEPWFLWDVGKDLPADAAVAPCYVEYPIIPAAAESNEQQIHVWMPEVFVRERQPDGKLREGAHLLEIHGASFVRVVVRLLVCERVDSAEDGFRCTAMWHTGASPNVSNQPSASSAPTQGPAPPPLPASPSQPRLPDLTVNGRDLYLRTDPAWYPPTWSCLNSDTPRLWQDTDLRMEERLALALRGELGIPMQFACVLQPDDPYRHLYPEASGTKDCDIRIVSHGKAAAMKGDALASLGIGKDIPSGNGCTWCYFERRSVPLGEVRLNETVSCYIMWMPSYSTGLGCDLGRAYTMMISGAPFSAYFLEYKVVDVDDVVPYQRIYRVVPVTSALVLPSVAPASFPDFDDWAEGESWPAAPPPSTQSPSTDPALSVLHLVYQHGAWLARHHDRRVVPPSWLDPEGLKPWRDATRSKRERIKLYARWQASRNSGYAWGVIIPPSKVDAYQGHRIKYKHAYSTIMTSTNAADLELQAKQDVWNALPSNSDIPDDVVYAPCYIEYPISALEAVAPGKQMVEFYYWVPELFVRVPLKANLDRCRLMEIEGSSYVRCMSVITIKEDSANADGFSLTALWEIDDARCELQYLPEPPALPAHVVLGAAYAPPVPSWIRGVLDVQPPCACKQSTCAVCAGWQQLQSLLARLRKSTANQRVISSSDVHELLSMCIKVATVAFLPGNDRAAAQRKVQETLLRPLCLHPEGPAYLPAAFVDNLLDSLVTVACQSSVTGAALAQRHSHVNVTNADLSKQLVGAAIDANRVRGVAANLLADVSSFGDGSSTSNMMLSAYAPMAISLFALCFDDSILSGGRNANVDGSRVMASMMYSTYDSAVQIRNELIRSADAKAEQSSRNALLELESESAKVAISKPSSKPKPKPPSQSAATLRAASGATSPASASAVTLPAPAATSASPNASSAAAAADVVGERAVEELSSAAVTSDAADVTKGAAIDLSGAAPAGASRSATTHSSDGSLPAVAQPAAPISHVTSAASTLPALRPPDRVVNGRELYLRTDPAWFPPNWAELTQLSPLPWLDKSRALDERVAVAARWRLATPFGFVCALAADDSYRRLYKELEGPKNCDVLELGIGGTATSKIDALQALAVGSLFPEKSGCTWCYFERPTQLPSAKVSLNATVESFVIWAPIHSVCFGYDVSDQHTILVDGAPYGALIYSSAVANVDLINPFASQYKPLPLARTIGIAAEAASESEAAAYSELDSWPSGSPRPSPPEPASALVSSTPAFVWVNGSPLLRHFDQRALPASWRDPHNSKPWRDVKRNKRERALLFLQHYFAARSGTVWSAVIPPADAAAHAGLRTSVKHSFSRLIKTNTKSASAVIAKQEAWAALAEGSCTPDDLVVAPCFVEYPMCAIASVSIGKATPVFHAWIPLAFALAAWPTSSKWSTFRPMFIEGGEYVRCICTETVLESSRSEDGFVAETVWEIDDGERDAPLPLDTTAATASGGWSHPVLRVDPVEGCRIRPLPNWIGDLKGLTQLCNCKKKACVICSVDKDIAQLKRRTAGKPLIAGSDVRECLSVCIRAAVAKCLPNENRAVAQRTILDPLLKELFVHHGDNDGVSFSPPAFVHFVLLPLCSMVAAIYSTCAITMGAGDDNVATGFDLVNKFLLTGWRSRSDDGMTRASRILQPLQKQASAHAPGADASKQRQTGMAVLCHGVAAALFAACFDCAVYNCDRLELGTNDLRQTILKCLEKIVVTTNTCTNPTSNESDHAGMSAVLAATPSPAATAATPESASTAAAPADPLPAATAAAPTAPAAAPAAPAAVGAIPAEGSAADAPLGWEAMADAMGIIGAATPTSTPAAVDSVPTVAPLPPSAAKVVGMRSSDKSASAAPASSIAVDAAPAKSAGLQRRRGATVAAAAVSTAPAKTVQSVAASLPASSSAWTSFVAAVRGSEAGGAATATNAAGADGEDGLGDDDAEGGIDADDGTDDAGAAGSSGSGLTAGLQQKSNNEHLTKPVATASPLSEFDLASAVIPGHLRKPGAGSTSGGAAAAPVRLSSPAAAPVAVIPAVQRLLDVARQTASAPAAVPSTSSPVQPSPSPKLLQPAADAATPGNATDRKPGSGSAPAAPSPRSVPSKAAKSAPAPSPSRPVAPAPAPSLPSKAVTADDSRFWDSDDDDAGGGDAEAGREEAFAFAATGASKPRTSGAAPAPPAAASVHTAGPDEHNSSGSTDVTTASTTSLVADASATSKSVWSALQAKLSSPGPDSKPASTISKAVKSSASSRSRNTAPASAPLSASALPAATSNAALPTVLQPMTLESQHSAAATAATTVQAALSTASTPEHPWTLHSIESRLLTPSRNGAAVPADAAATYTFDRLQAFKSLWDGAIDGGSGVVPVHRSSSSTTLGLESVSAATDTDATAASAPSIYDHSHSMLEVDIDWSWLRSEVDAVAAENAAQASMERTFPALPWSSGSLALRDFASIADDRAGTDGLQLIQANPSMAESAQLRKEVSVLTSTVAELQRRQLEMEARHCETESQSAAKIAAMEQQQQSMRNGMDEMWKELQAMKMQASKSSSTVAEGKVTAVVKRSK